MSISTTSHGGDILLGSNYEEPTGDRVLNVLRQDTKWGRWASNPRPRDYEVGANRQIGPVVSNSFEIPCIHCPAVSDWSGGVGFVYRMKRGISFTAIFKQRYTEGTSYRSSSRHERDMRKESSSLSIQE